MRRKDDALHGVLLELARQMADAEGIDAVNIRSLAKAAGVATGTVYNYFAGKDDILLALTEAYWRQTLADMRAVITADSFCGQLEQIYAFLRLRIDRSAGRLMNSLGTASVEGRERMTAMQSTLVTALIQRMDRDPSIPRDIWTDPITQEKFARFIMMNMVMLLRTGAEDMSFLTAVISRVLGTTRRN